MPRFHFDVDDGHVTTRDPDGVELPDAEAARREAIRDAREMMSDSDRTGRCRRHWRMLVRDAAGGRIFTLPFGQAIESDYMPRDRVA